MQAPKQKPSIHIFRIRGLGHVPALKNAKMLAKKRNGQSFLMTKPKVQMWMENAIRVIGSQLCSAFPTEKRETVPDVSALLRMSGFVPLDDSREWMTAGSYEWKEVAPGEEGADIIIERLD